MNMRELAAAVTLQAVQDYYDNKCSLAELHYYFNYSPFFQILDIDSERALKACILRKAVQNEKNTNISRGKSGGNMDDKTTTCIHSDKNRGK